VPRLHTTKAAGGRILHHVTRENTTVVACLQQHFRLTEVRAQELIDLGAIYSNKRRVLENLKLDKGTYLRLHLEPKRFPVESVDWKKVIVHRTKDYLIINKPAGIPVHASVDNLQDNVLHQLRLQTGKHLLVTQRLDVPVAGVMLLACHPDFQRRFNQWLVDRKITKYYRALSSGVPENPGRQIHYMEPSERSPKRISAEALPNWLRCELTLNVVETRPDGICDLGIELHTGRTHQIRAQLGFLRVPILGDRLYGARKSYRPGEIALFSNRLGFPPFYESGRQFEIDPAWPMVGHETATPSV
jgi:23S rRNA pseudouridine1911/1915/1917 synthase